VCHGIEQRSDTAPADAARRHARPVALRRPSAGPGARRSSRITHHSSFSPGFTLVELMIAAVVMTMTLAALTALTIAVSDGWRSAEQPQSTSLAVSRGANRFLEMIKSARYLGWAGARSDGNGSAVMLWEQDDADVGRMQLGEIALLEFEPGPKTVTLYRVPATAPNAGMLCDVGDIDDEADVAAFKKAGNVTAQVVLHDVVALDVWAHDNVEPTTTTTPVTTIKARPRLEYALRVVRGNERGWSYETVTLRAPARAPVKCAGGSSCGCTSSGGCACASARSCACGAGAPCRSASNTACCTTTTTTAEAEASGTSDASN
jgi:Tfp pilus assembly protein PilV